MVSIPALNAPAMNVTIVCAAQKNTSPLTALAAKRWIVQILRKYKNTSPAPKRVGDVSFEYIVVWRLVHVAPISQNGAKPLLGRT